MSTDIATEQVDLAELLRMAFRDGQLDLHVAMPARVEAYHVVTQTVDVVPQLNRALPDGAGNFVSEALPKLVDVPVKFQRCGKFAITFPLEPGDFVMLVFCERSIGAWRATGAQGDPGDVGMHTLDGAVAIPGLYPDTKPAASADGSVMRIGSDTDANGRIEFTANEIRLGQGATAGIARVGDTVTVTIPAHAIGGDPSADLDVTGTITAGSSSVKAL